MMVRMEMRNCEKISMQKLVLKKVKHQIAFNNRMQEIFSRIRIVSYSETNIFLLTAGIL